MNRLRLLVLAVCMGMTLVGCGGTDGDSGGEKSGGVETDVTVPSGSDFNFQMSAPIDESVASQGAGRNQRAGQTRFNFTGVGSGMNFSLIFVVDAVEGDTGNFETVQTAQLTWGSKKYVSSEALDLTIDTYEGGEISAALKGTFPERQTSSGRESVSPPVEIEGRFEFSYD